MKLRTKYLVFIIIVHLITLVLSFYVFRENKILFIVSEAVILVSLAISWSLYRELIKPLRFLLQGVDAIRERDFNIRFVPTGSYEMDQLIDVYNQMIDQLRMERTRQEQQHLFLEKLVHTSPTGILILDYDDMVQQVNPKALQLLGAEENEVLNRHIHTLSNPILQHIAQLRSGESKTISSNGVNTYKLQKSHFIDRGFARHFIMVEELTAEILAAEKKAYGKVIRMMAHEVNNTIGPVNSILQTIIDSGALSTENNNGTLQNALQVAVDRNYNLNQFMRNFADVVRLPQPLRKQVDLHGLIRHITALMAIKAGEKTIRFQFHMPETPFFINADAHQLEQVLINVVKNAMESIESDGKIVFTTDPASRKLIITDSGAGITASTADQLFSPFFSTKKDGQGIGLTLVKEILLNHGFEFSLKTVAVGRTEFSMKF